MSETQTAAKPYVTWRPQDDTVEREWVKHMILACDLRKEAAAAGLAIDLFEQDYTVEEVKRVLGVRKNTKVDGRLDQLYAKYAKRKATLAPAAAAV